MLVRGESLKREQNRAVISCIEVRVSGEDEGWRGQY